ncbi:hypothetical protein ZIOFF_064962 [Zingiber officinale]|uniref:GHMP kinase N-terminal domain-containing protein n=1 Tax=Zingiber officinale TaxID=94328 RepID=A0A8J5F0W5_ZINOF|nr:hypothetical protein ZIOFF_064962 [Zingiber officinale]
MATVAAPTRTFPLTRTPLNRTRPFSHFSRLRCSVGAKAPILTTSIASNLTDPSSTFCPLTAFAPATVANLDLGFDFLGCAVGGGLGDTVTISVDPAVTLGTLSIAEISGSSSTSKLRRDLLWNCAGIAGIAVMCMLGVCSVSLSLPLHKGLPVGSSLGSSAASIAVAALAVSKLFGGYLTPDELVLAGLESEKKVSGYRVDNLRVRGAYQEDEGSIASKHPNEGPYPELESSRNLGGCRGVRQCEGSRICNGSGCNRRAEESSPNFEDGECEEGSNGGSDSGPTAVAIIDEEEKGNKIASRMVEAFTKEGNLQSIATVAKLDRVGARVFGTESA